MRAGPKRAVDESPLPIMATGSPLQQFYEFCRDHLVVPKGHGQGKPFQLRPWQRELVGSALDGSLKTPQGGGVDASSW